MCLIASIFYRFSLNKAKPLMFFVMFYLFTTGMVLAQSSKEKLQKEKQKLEEEIAYTNKLLKETKVNTKISLNQLIILNNQIARREELIEAYQKELRKIEYQIAERTAKLKSLTAELSTLKEQYAKMIYFAYKNRSSYDRLMFVFASKDFNQAYLRLKYLQQYSLYRKQQAELIVQTQKMLNEIIAELEKQKAEKRDLLGLQIDEKSKLAKEKEEKNNSVKSLQKKEKDLIKTLKEKEESARKLQKAIEKIIAEEIRKAAERNKKNIEKPKANAPPTTFAMTPEETKLSNDFAENKGNLPWPSERGVIIGTFGVHPHPILDGITTKNNGVDIATNKGSVARAVFGGVVSGVVSVPGSNQVVIIRHGEYLTVYANLSQVYVKAGDKISTKQQIGIVDTDGEDGKTILHLEIWNGKITLNPSEWISKSK